MKIAKVQTRCECQARLFAEIDENGLVVRGSVQFLDEIQELSPATAVGAQKDYFQVGWLCPICGRNTLRSFYRPGLQYRSTQAA